jgi:hypothetical protein
MKPTALSLAIAAAAFGATTVYLSMQLQEERAQADKLLTETRALNDRIAQLEKARAEHRVATVNPFARGILRSGAATGQAAHAGQSSEPPNVVIEELPLDAPPRNLEFMNKMMRSQVRAHNKQLYADIGTRLGLSKEEANKLIDLLTAQQLESSDSWSQAKDFQDLHRQMEEKQRQDKAKIAELIGADKAQSLEEYQQSLPARQEAEMLARQLDGADAPLSEEQQKRLMAVLLEERKRTPAPRMGEFTSPQEQSKAFSAWQTEYNENVASQVRSILDTDQLAAYNEYVEWQRQMFVPMNVVNAGPMRPLPAGGAVLFTTAAPVMSADVAVAAPAPDERPTPKK